MMNARGCNVTHIGSFSHDGAGLLTQPCSKRLERVFDELIRHGLGAEVDGFAERDESRAA